MSLTGCTGAAEAPQKWGEGTIQKGHAWKRALSFQKRAHLSFVQKVGEGGTCPQCRPYNRAFNNRGYNMRGYKTWL